MKKFSVILGLFIMIVSFQNCAQQKVDLAGIYSVGTPVNKGSEDVQETPIEEIKKVVLWDPSNKQFLDLDIDSGKMIAFEEGGTVLGKNYCLSEPELVEVKTILLNSSICEKRLDIAAAKDQVCTMLYRYPYASIDTGKNEYRLGEMTSGCDQPMDLCGDKSLMLKNFIAGVVSQLSLKVCQ
jgi:hypothetical protein